MEFLIYSEPSMSPKYAPPITDKTMDMETLLIIYLTFHCYLVL